MLALLVFNKAKGTGSASNKALKPLPSVAGTPIRGAASPIMPHVSAPLSLKLGALIGQKELCRRNSSEKKPKS